MKNVECGTFNLILFLDSDRCMKGVLSLHCSRDFLRDNPQLVCTDTASYLTMWCVNLEVQEVRCVSQGATRLLAMEH